MVPEIQTERLKLARIDPADQGFIFEGLSHPQVIPFYGVRYDSFEATKAQMEFYERMLADGSGIPWKLVEQESGAAVGVLAVYGYKAEHRKAELGFWLLPNYWGKGYAREAVQAAIAYWQAERNLHRLEAFVETENEASWRLLERCGFAYEGLMRDSEWKEGRWISLKIYALLSASAPEQEFQGQFIAF